MNFDESLLQIEECRESGKKIGFINGCFDLFHQGHQNLIDKAYEHCDHLVVGVNSDESIQARKGSNRPIQSQEIRARRVADALSKDSETVYIFHDEEQLLDLIKMIRPHIMFKSSEYIFKRQQVTGWDFMVRNGTVMWIDRLEGISTEKLIEEKYMNFGSALALLKDGNKLAREGWNGKSMFIYYVPANKYPASGNTLGTMKGLFPDDMVPYDAYIAMKTAQDNVVPWLASQTDVLAEDWCIVE